MRHTPTTYYARDSGVGLAIRFCCPDSPPNSPRRIGVIGLGAGTIAAYGRPGDRIRFYEINPAVQPIARNVFTYIRDSGAQVDVVEGDARTSLAAKSLQRFDVLVVDAFSGDAIPIHLLTPRRSPSIAAIWRPTASWLFTFPTATSTWNRRSRCWPPPPACRPRHVYSLGQRRPRRDITSTWMLVTDNADFFPAARACVAHAFAPDTKPGLQRLDRRLLQPAASAARGGVSALESRNR